MTKFTIEAEIEIPQPPETFRVMLPGRERALNVPVEDLTQEQLTDITTEWGRKLRELAKRPAEAPEAPADEPGE